MIPKRCTSFPLSLSKPCAHARKPIWQWQKLSERARREKKLSRQSQNPLSQIEDQEHLCVNFQLLLRQMDFNLLPGAGHTSSTQQGVALVSESSLELPVDGGCRGSLRSPSQKGNVGKRRGEWSSMFVFRSSLSGAWLPAEPYQLLSPASHSPASRTSCCLLSGVALGGCILGRCQATLTGITPEGTRTPGETGTGSFFCWNGRTFLLSIFIMEKEGKKDGREGKNLL